MTDFDRLAAVVSDEGRRRKERTAAIRELLNSGDVAAVAPLVAGLRAQHTTVAVGCAVALGRLRRREVVPGLIEALESDGRKNVRLYSADSLGKIGDPAAAEALERATSDRTEAIRNMAASALKRVQRAAAARVAADPSGADQTTRAVAAQERRYSGFSIPVVLAGLVGFGVVAFWVGGAEDFVSTALPAMGIWLVIALGWNAVARWWTNR